MATLDEMWAWIYEPLADTTEYRKSNPERAWNDVRAYLLERLGLRDSTDRPFTDDLFRQFDEMREDDRRVLLDDTDKLTTFAYEIAQKYAEEPPAQHNTQQTPAPENPAQYDANAWQAFLVENGTRWNGTAESWSQFEKWIRYEADKRGLGYPATGLFEYLASQSVSGRIATLKQYGVPITAPVAPQPAQQTAQPPEPVEFTDSDLADLLAEDPDLAEIPEARRQEILAEVLAELNRESAKTSDR